MYGKSGIPGICFHVLKSTRIMWFLISFYWIFNDDHTRIVRVCDTAVDRHCLDLRATAQPQYRPGASRSHLQDSAFSHFAVDSTLASTVSHLYWTWVAVAYSRFECSHRAWNRGRWSRTADGRSGQISLYVKPSVHGKSVANGRWSPTAEVANGRFE